MQNQGDPERMQFSSEFEWISPSGRGLLTHYMPAHYSAGWWMDSSATLEEAETATCELFSTLKRVALTRNVLLPVGTDYTPPNKWVTEIHRDWNERYTWPRFVCGLPREFFASVRAELDERGIAPSPQTRDMNPIYTGKDVSYIDTKQANRDAENAVLDGERFAVFAGLLGGATYPQAALEKAWVQLAYGAHHDAITGSESDQVYLDLLTGWRDAWELGCAARDNALAVISSAVDGSVVVWNTLSHKRTDVVTVRLDEPLGDGARVIDADGNELPALVEHGGRSVSWLARDIPSLGWRAYRLATGSASTSWKAVSGRDSRSATSGIDCGWIPAVAVRCRRSPRAAANCSPTARSATSWRCTTNTPHIRMRGRGRGICYPKGRWLCRRVHQRSPCGATARRWGSGWWCAVGSVRCCATPRL